MNVNKRTAVLTGSTGGIGLEISKIMASQGWNLVLVNRSQEKTELQLEDLRESFSKQNYQGYTADLMDVSDINRVVQDISADHPEISALYNIAGLLTDKRVMSRQDVEGHFAVNALAPYLLTKGLRAQLAAGASKATPSVVVNFSSSAVKSVKKLDVSTLTNPQNIGGLMGAYAQSKMAVTAITILMKEALFEESILILSADPGPTKSQMTDAGDGIPWFLRLLRPLIFKPASVQAEKLVKAVDSVVSEKKTGLFITQGYRKPNPAIALNQKIQNDLGKLLDTLAVP